MSRSYLNNRVGEIEFLRFFFCLVIAIFHSQYLFKDGMLPAFKGGAYAVEFFLLVSGYLLMASLSRLQDRPIDNLGKETFTFVLNKARPIYLDIVLAYIIGFGVQWASQAAEGDFGTEQVLTLLKRSIFEVLLIQRAGIGDNAVNSVIWYVQSMLLCMFILYPLARKFPEFCKRVLFPLAALLIIGWLMMNHGNLRNPTKWIGLSFKGNVRCMGVLCLGSVCYTVAQWLKQFRFRAVFRTLLAVFKWGCWLSVLWYIDIGEMNMDDFYLLLMAIAVTLTFSQQCIDTRLFQNRMCMWLGKISLPIYLNHLYFAKYLPALLPIKLSDKRLFAVYAVISFATAMLTMLVAFLLRKLWPYMKKGLAWMIVKRPKATEQA